jgi:uncharacterized protein YegL
MSYENHPLFQQLKTLLFGGGEFSNASLMQEARAYAASAPLIAQTLVDDLNHKIRLRSQQHAGGCTDGTTVSIGPVPMPQDNGDVGRFVLFLALMLGLIHHEVGHVNGTDFKARRSSKKFLHPIEGTLEDVRQELAHIGKVRSGRKWLDALSLASIITGLNGPVSQDEPPIGVFTGYLLFRCRADFRGEPWFEALAEGYETRMEEVFPKGITVRLDVLLQEVPSLTCTADSLALAKKIGLLLNKELKEAQKQQQQQQQQQQQPGAGSGQGGGGTSGQPDDSASSAGEPGDAGDTGDTSDTGDSSADGSKANSGGDPSQGSGNGNADSNQPGDASDSANSGSGCNGAGGSDQVPDPRIQALEDLLSGQDADQAHGDLDQQVRNVMQQLSNELGSDGAEMLDPDLDAIQNADQATVTSQVHAGLGVDLGSALGVVGRLASRLRIELQTLSTTKTGRAITGTRIDTKALTRVPLGDARIFRKTTTGITVDTAVVLLCDVSGSMSGTKIEVADQALFATAVALQSCPGISVAVATFPGNQVVLPFGGRARREAERFKLCSFGGTPMEQGILLAQRMLTTRREPRKLVFVLSDGEPNSHVTARARIAAAEKAGLELYGIGIQDDAVRDLFRRWTVVNNVGELPAQLLSMLRGRLLAVA